MSSLPGADAIREKIDLAFAEVPMPTPRELVMGTGAIDEPGVVENYAGKIRTDLPQRLTSHLGEDIYYMSTKGLQYYLPVFLKFLLTEDGFLEDRVMNQVVYLLRKKDAPNLIRWASFSTKQKTAVVAWMEFLLRLDANSDDLGLDFGDSRANLQQALINWKSA